MKLSECPKCKKNLLIPGSHMSVIAKCPHCDEEFSLDGQPCEDVPVVELIRSQDNTETEEQSITETLVEHRDDEFAPNIPIHIPSDHLFQDDGERSAKLAEKAVSPTGTIYEVPSPFDGGAQEVRNPEFAVERGKSTSKRKNGFLWEATKIFLGGTAGIFIAQMILWWLPGDLKRDPFDLAEKLPNSLSFLVPKDLWDKTHTETNTKQPERSDEKLPESTTDPPQQNTSQAPSNDSSADDSENVVDGSFTANNPPLDPTNNSTKKTTTTTEEPPPSETIDDAAAKRSLQILNAPTISVTDFDTAHQRARAANSETGDSASSSTSKAQRKFYLRMSELARAVTYLDRSSRDAVQRLDEAEELLIGIGKNGFKTDVVGVGAAGWISYRRRTTTGIAYAGRVKAIEPRGQVYAVRLSLKGRPKKLATMILPAPPQDDARMPFDVGDSVFGLGTIIEEPNNQIPFYAGSPETVIWSGLHVTIDE